MIELQKVKRDVINYGALKVYTTFLTISEDEVDPELFAASQLKEIFEKKFDVIKVDISFVEGEEAEVVGKELLVFKLSKCSDDEVSYMSNVDDEGKLSSLVLTKSEGEVSLEVVEYAVGGSGGSKLYLHEFLISEHGNDTPTAVVHGFIVNDKSEALLEITKNDNIISLELTLMDNEVELATSINLAHSMVFAGRLKLRDMIYQPNTILNPPDLPMNNPMLFVDTTDNTVKSIDYYSRLNSIRQDANYVVEVIDTVTEL